MGEQEGPEVVPGGQTSMHCARKMCSWCVCAFQRLGRIGTEWERLARSASGVGPRSPRPGTALLARQWGRVVSPSDVPAGAWPPPQTSPLPSTPPPRKVANLGRAIHLQLCSVRIPQAKEKALHAITLLARTHTPELVATFLDFSIPLDRCQPPSALSSALLPAPSQGPPGLWGQGGSPHTCSFTAQLPRQAPGRHHSPSILRVSPILQVSPTDPPRHRRNLNHSPVASGGGCQAPRCAPSKTPANTKVSPSFLILQGPPLPPPPPRCGHPVTLMAQGAGVELAFL